MHLKPPQVGGHTDPAFIRCAAHDLTNSPAVRTHKKTSDIGMLPVMLPLDVIKSTFTCKRNGRAGASE